VNFKIKGFRVVVDEANEKMGWKIRQSQTHKIPYQIVIGDQEQADGTVNIRRYGSKETKVIPLEEFIENISADVANFSRVD
jgi:threonyl-tRNA synthetase